jgi:hypothetical protein
MSACPSSEEPRATASNLFEEVSRLKKASQDAVRNYHAILERIDKLEKILREREKHRAGGENKAG